MFCEECGREIPDGSLFCGYCGARMEGPATGGYEAQPPAAGPQAYGPPPPPVGAPPPGPPAVPPAVPPVDYTSQAGTGAPSPRRSPLPWILGGIGVLVAVAVVLVLVFVVFKGGGPGPEKTVEDFFRAIEKQDSKMLLDLFEPSFREELEDALGKDLELMFEDYFFADYPEDLKIEIRKMETRINGDKAVVTVVDGTMSYTDEDGKRVSEEASEADMEAMELIRVGGKWYLSGDYLRDMGLDPDELADLDFDEWDEYGDEDEWYGDEEEYDEDEWYGDEEEYDEDEWYGEDEDLADVEAAMIAFVKENAVEGLEFEIFNLLVRGDEAVGLAICTNQEVDAPQVIMERGRAGWYGVDVSTDLDPPSWYRAEIAELKDAMIAFVKENAVEGLEFEIEDLLFRGDEAVGFAVCTNQEVDAPLVIMERGPGGWYGVEVGTGIEAPYWYPWD